MAMTGPALVPVALPARWQLFGESAGGGSVMVLWGGGRPPWLNHDPSVDRLINFTGTGIVAGPDPLKARLDLWRRIFYQPPQDVTVRATPPPTPSLKGRGLRIQGVSAPSP
jgi:hypothetical protein